MVRTKRFFRFAWTLMVSALGFANCTKPDEPAEDPWGVPGYLLYGPLPPSSYMETLPVSDDPVAEAASVSEENLQSEEVIISPWE